MKKLTIVAVCVVLIFSMFPCVIYAQNISVNGLQDSMKNLWLKNQTDNELLQLIKESYSEYVSKYTEGVMSSPQYARKGLGLMGSDEEQIAQLKKNQRLTLIKLYKFAH